MKDCIRKGTPLTAAPSKFGNIIRLRMRKMTKNLGISTKLVGRIVKENITSYRTTKARNQKLRLKKCKSLLANLRFAEHFAIVFSIEKVVTVVQVLNPQMLIERGELSKNLLILLKSRSRPVCVTKSFSSVARFHCLAS